MSQYGISVAHEYGKDLPVFESFEEAEKSLLVECQLAIESLLSQADLIGLLNFSPESLKFLEKWYFENSEPAKTKNIASVNKAIGFYFGEVLCRNSGYKWVVKEYAFSKNYFEIGVQKGRGSIMLTKGRKLKTEGNKLKQSMFREFKKFSP